MDYSVEISLVIKIPKAVISTESYYRRKNFITDWGRRCYQLFNAYP